MLAYHDIRFMSFQSQNSPHFPLLPLRLTEIEGAQHVVYLSSLALRHVMTDVKRECKASGKVYTLFTINAAFSTSFSAALPLTLTGSQ